MRKKMKTLLSLLLALTMVLSSFPVMAAEPAAEGGIILASPSGAAPIYIDRDSADYDGLSLIAIAAAEDFEAVSGQKSEVYAVATASEARNPVLEPEIKDHVVNKLGSESTVIIAGTVNDSLIQSLGLKWDIKASNESFKSEDFERYQIQVVTVGGQTRIVIAGSDKRGTIYGLFHITQDLCGVSPWIWWADVKPAHKDTLAFSRTELETVSKRPSVNYRGFFFNDENPNLDGFADSHFGGLNYMFYNEVFELMLRLKGNFLWPAMWSNSFGSDGVEGLGSGSTAYSSFATGNKFAKMEADYHYLLGGAMYVDQPGNKGARCDAPNTNTTNYTSAESKALGDGSLKAIGYGEYPMTLANAVLATRYGVMVGASHHEPMARAGVEWGDLQGSGTYKQPNVNGSTSGNDIKAWNYLTNPTNLSNFWSDGIKRNGSFDNLLTIGMRGENDTALTDASGRTLSTKQNAELLKDVIREQDRILRQYGLEDTPQLIALYKEVENCWYAGDRNNPSNADKSAALYFDSEITDLLGADTNRIVMFCEDNNGYLRTLGEYGEKERFNYGLYYHFDYVGSPHTSMWTNTMPLQRTWDNLTTAYEYGVDDAWIVNVGDLKPMELPLSYFMELAYDFETYGSNAANDTEETITAEEYYEIWARQQFAAADLTDEEYAELAEVLHDYTQLNGNRKPEQQKNNTYNLTNYNEAQRTLAYALNIEDIANKYLDKFAGTDLYDAYYELVYYCAIQSANTNKMLIYQGLNQQYANAKSALTNIYADKVNSALAADRAYTAEYNKLGPDLNGQPKWYRMMITSPFNNEQVCGITARAHLNYSSWNNDSSQTFRPTTVTLSQGASMLVNVTGSSTYATSGTQTLPDFDSTVKQAYYINMSNAGSSPVEYEITNVPEWVILDGDTKGHFTTAAVIGVRVDWSKISADTSGSFRITTAGGQTVTIQVNAKNVIIPDDVPNGTAFISNGEFSFIADHYTAMGTGHSKGSDNKEVGWVSIPGYGKTEGSVKPFPVYTDDCAAGEGPWLDYSVYVPAGQSGSYSLNIFFGQSNDISFFEGKELNFALQVNGGAIQTKNALTNNYVAGGNGWYDNILNCGHTMSYGNITLKEGLNTVRIYAMDQNLLLQKIVISKGSSYKSSYMGAPQSYRKGDAIPEQQALVFDAYVDHDHVYQSSRVEPTCTQPGSETGKCTICGTTITTTLKALGHDWDEGIVIREATETMAGSKHCTCKRCGAEKDIRIPRIGATVPDDIDFTDAASADRFEVVNQNVTEIRNGQGLYLITTKDGFEPANDQLSGTAATTPKDLVLIPVEGDWAATMEFTFSQGSASNGYYQFFGFYAMQDYNNAAGIRGGNNALQNFLRVGGTITADSSDLNSAPGLGSNGTYWFKLVKEGTTYTCLRSSDGEDYTEMFAYEDTGIEADKIAIDAYTGMTEGYQFYVKSLKFEDAGGAPSHEHTYESALTPPTCVKKGYTTYTCTVCGKSYTDNEVPALGHDFIDGKCTRCGEIYVDELVNYALRSNGGSAAASAGVEGNVNNVIDGTRIKSTRIRWASDNLPATLTITLSEPRNISIVDVISQVPDTVESGITEMGETTNLGLKGITVSYSEDGSSWNVFANGDSGNNLAWQRFEKAEPVKAQYIRIEIEQEDTFDGWARILEVQVFGRPIGSEVHTHQYTKLVTAPTCTEEGYTTYTCTCGESYVADKTAALGHDIQETTVAATCTETGSITKTCSRCDYKDVTEIPALGHSYVNGKCSRCGDKDPDYVCNGGEACPSKLFTDAPKAGTWAHAGIDYCVETGLMKGVSDGIFNPNGTVTRGQLVTILYRIAGEPEFTTDKQFSDVAEGRYYTKAVLWAAENSIVTGYSDGTFLPNREISREQIAAILYRYEGSPEVTGKLDFPDAAKAGSYAESALIWATQKGLITGVKTNGVTLLSPKASAPRAQIATIIMRYLES